MTDTYGSRVVPPQDPRSAITRALLKQANPPPMPPGVAQLPGAQAPQPGAPQLNAPLSPQPAAMGPAAASPPMGPMGPIGGAMQPALQLPGMQPPGMTPPGMPPRY